MTSKVQPAANYWTKYWLTKYWFNDIKSAARCRLLNRWPRKPRNEVVLCLVSGKTKERNAETPLKTGKHFQWKTKQLLTSSFVEYEEIGRSRGRYPPRPSAYVDNTLLDRQNSSYPTQPHSIIAKYLQIIPPAVRLRSTPLAKDWEHLNGFEWCGHLVRFRSRNKIYLYFTQ